MKEASLFNDPEVIHEHGQWESRFFPLVVPSESLLCSNYSSIANNQQREENPEYLINIFSEQLSLDIFAAIKPDITGDICAHPKTASGSRPVVIKTATGKRHLKATNGNITVIPRAKANITAHRSRVTTNHRRSQSLS